MKRKEFIARVLAVVALPSLVKSDKPNILPIEEISINEAKRIWDESEPKIKARRSYLQTFRESYKDIEYEQQADRFVTEFELGLFNIKRKG